MGQASDDICIICPKGCNLQVEKTFNGYIVQGNFCIKGEKYAIAELTNPKRLFTSTIEIENTYLNRLLVRTDKEISKDLIFKFMDYLKLVKIKAPVKIGDIIIKDILGTGVNLIATRNMNALE